MKLEQPFLLDKCASERFSAECFKSKGQKVINFGVGKSSQEAKLFCQAVGMDLPSDKLNYAATYLFEEIQNLIGGKPLCSEPVLKFSEGYLFHAEINDTSIVESACLAGWQAVEISGKQVCYKVLKQKRLSVAKHVCSKQGGRVRGK